MGSAAELEYELLLSRELGYLREPEYTGLARSIDEVKRKLANLAGSLAPPQR